MPERLGREGQAAKQFGRDENGEVIPVRHWADKVEASYWTAERLAEVEDLDRAARALAPSLVGLSVDAARDTVAAHQGLSVLFLHPGCTYITSRAFGQITAGVRNDVVESAS